MKTTRKCAMCINHHEDMVNLKNHKCVYNDKKHFENCEACKKIAKRREFVAKAKKEMYRRNRI